MKTSLPQRTTLDRIFGWWYAIAAPSAPSGSILIRKGKFTSLVLLLEFLINVPNYFVSSNLLLIIPMTISMFILCIGVVLNRAGKTVIAGILVVTVIEVGMCAWIVSFGFTGGGLSLIDLPLFAILIQPILIAVSLFPPKVSLSLGAFNSVFIASAIFFLPKTPELLHYLPMPTFAFTIYFVPIINQIFATLISILWASSALGEMKRAAHAEEVSKLAVEMLMDPMILEQMLNKLQYSRQQSPPDPRDEYLPSYESWYY
jgi:hypothetical protein